MVEPIMTPPVIRKAMNDKNDNTPKVAVIAHFLTLSAIKPTIPTTIVLRVSPKSA